MISRHSLSRWVVPAGVVALQLMTLLCVSGQEPSTPAPPTRRLVLSEGERALVRARAAMKAENFVEAYADFRAALNSVPRSGPQHDEALRGLSESGVKLAEQRLKEGRAPEAARLAREVLTANANYRPALEVLARSTETGSGNVPIVRSTPPSTRRERQTFTGPAKTPAPRTAPTPVPRTLVNPRILSTRPPATSAESPPEVKPEATPPPEEEPPEVSEMPPEEEPAATPQGVKQPLVKVFFATDRQHISGATGPANYFGTERNADPDPDDQHLLTGFVKVSIPPVHEPGGLERPFKWWIIEFKEDEKKHIVLKELTMMQSDDFYGALRTEYDERAPENRSAFVFIHGFKTSFDDAAYRTAQLAYDLNFEGVPIMYSWPSKNSLLAYATDRRTTDWSWRHLQYFVERIARESGALRIHLIAHSMGNQLLVQALDGLGRQPEIKPLFDNVVMAAPDVDAKTFREQNWAGIRDAAKRFTLYASSDDWALKVSRELEGGSDFVRLGEAGGALVVVPGLDTIDASGIDTNELGHSYYHCKKLMDDLQVLMAKSWAPLERNLRNRPKGDLTYWAFP